MNCLVRISKVVLIFQTSTTYWVYIGQQFKSLSTNDHNYNCSKYVTISSSSSSSRINALELEMLYQTEQMGISIFGSSILSEMQLAHCISAELLTN